MALKFNPFTGTLDVVSTTTGLLSDAFTTVSVPNGTAPTASGADTLVLTSSDNSITITGNSGTDTVDFILNQALLSEYQVEKFTLSPAQIAAKSITLAQMPTTANLTRLIVIGGPEQDYATDFTVSGTTLDWNGLGLDGILISGDKLVVIYNE